MLNFTVPQWVLLFYLYSFIGWIWECCFVRFSQGVWMNRGFLHGPILPIYGFGALVIQLTTLQVSESYIKVFFYGMVAASLLEYMTGDVMERLFKVRYWDYSNEKFNLNGHICLYASIGWGVGSVILVEFANKPFNMAVSMIPYSIAELLALSLSIVASIDAATSTREALDLRELLEKIAANNREIKKIYQAIDNASVELMMDVNELKVKINENREALYAKLAKTNERLEAMRDEVREEGITKSASKRLIAAVERTNAYREQKLNDMIMDLEYVIMRMDEKLSECADPNKLLERKNELAKMRKSILAQRSHLGLSNRNYINAKKILSRFPTASSLYKEAFEQVSKLSERSEDK